MSTATTKSTPHAFHTNRVRAGKAVDIDSQTTVSMIVPIGVSNRKDMLNYIADVFQGHDGIKPTETIKFDRTAEQRFLDVTLTGNAKRFYESDLKTSAANTFLPQTFRANSVSF